MTCETFDSVLKSWSLLRKLCLQCRRLNCPRDWLTKCQYVWHFWLRGNVFTHVFGQCVTMHLSMPAQLFARQTESLARTRCSWTPPSQKGITDLDHVAFVGSLRLKHWLHVCPFWFFMKKRNTNALIHSHMYSQSNPASWNKKAVGWAEVCRSSCIF